ncbi:hypothetical protein [Streptomyces sp. NPDC059631]|uniref:hypothetical protein n=1 Tax=unclassified Streptomyces TaxID=2593676 RepID=UPI003680930F
MTQSQQVLEQRLFKLSVFLDFAADWKRETAEGAALASEGLTRPGVLTDAHVERMKLDCDERDEDLAMFRGQAERWAERSGLSSQQRSQVAQLRTDLTEISRLNEQIRTIRTTSSLLARATLEQQMSAPDTEWGLAALLGEQLPPRF